MINNVLVFPVEYPPGFLNVFAERRKHVRNRNCAYSKRYST